MNTPVQHLPDAPPAGNNTHAAILEDPSVKDMLSALSQDAAPTVAPPPQQQHMQPQAPHIPPPLPMQQMSMVHPGGYMGAPPAFAMAPSAFAPLSHKGLWDAHKARNSAILAVAAFLILYVGWFETLLIRLPRLEVVRVYEAMVRFLLVVFFFYALFQWVLPA